MMAANTTHRRTKPHYYPPVNITTFIHARTYLELCHYIIGVEPP